MCGGAQAESHPWLGLQYLCELHLGAEVVMTTERADICLHCRVCLLGHTSGHLSGGMVLVLLQEVLELQYVALGAMKVQDMLQA